MRVIGIDPGYDRLGVAVLEGTAHSQTLVYSTCLVTEKKLPLSKRYHQIGIELAHIIEKYAPERMGIETLFFNKNIKTALSVAEARGVILYVAECAQLSIHEYSPQAIKIAVTGHGASSKDQVSQMLTRLIKNIPTGMLDDEYDAIASGITCLVSERFV